MSQETRVRILVGLITSTSTSTFTFILRYLNRVYAIKTNVSKTQLEHYKISVRGSVFVNTVKLEYKRVKNCNEIQMIEIDDFTQ